jgi:eukaryotic-like serine/threonine-protein kinase
VQHPPRLSGQHRGGKHEDQSLVRPRGNLWCRSFPRALREADPPHGGPPDSGAGNVGNPEYKGTFERSSPADLGPQAERERTIAWSRDLGRTIDYLETRSDVDRNRLAFYGVSGGAGAGVILTALEPRLKASVLQAVGVSVEPTPEIDLVNYAPRVRLPTLMVNGRYDFEIPFHGGQRPLFELLGTEHKRHAVLESGHALPPADVALEILPWLDRYLGPVTPRSSTVP